MTDGEEILAGEELLDRVARLRHNCAMIKRGQLVACILLPLFVGAVGFFHLVSQPRFASIRTVDVVQLTGSGMCVGVALCAFIALLRSKRDG